MFTYIIRKRANVVKLRARSRWKHLHTRCYNAKKTANCFSSAV